MSEYQDRTPPMSAVPPGSAADYETAAQPSMSDRASGAMDQGRQAASDVASTAADKAREVQDETTRQARDLLGEARGHLRDQASEQHRNVVSTLRSLSSELANMHSDQPGLASELVTQARTRVEDVADWLDRRQPGDLVNELRTFARRRPGVFLLGAAVAGVAAGRVTRGAVAAHSDDSGSATPSVPEPTGGYEEPTSDLYALGATPTTPHDPIDGPARSGDWTPGHAYGVPGHTTPSPGSPTYPPTGGGYGGPQ